MVHENTSVEHRGTAYPYGPRDECGVGLFLPLMDERGWVPGLRMVLYFIALLYFFLGVSIITDKFMSAIEIITSKTRTIRLARTIKATKNGKYKAVEDNKELKPEEDKGPETVEVRVWNDTVANLTLMALGTSAPEIMLSIIEIVGHGFEAGELGPGTIVGSAAYNLLVISAICMLCLDGSDTRRVHRFKVFLVTGVFSFMAYIWLYLILNVISPEEVSIWEAGVTFILFPVLILFAYIADRGWLGLKGPPEEEAKTQIELGISETDRKTAKEIAEDNFFVDGKLDHDNLVKFIKEVKKYRGITDEDAALLAAAKLHDMQPHSSLYYRIGAVRTLSGGRGINPVLNEKLKQVYEAVNDHPLGPDLGDVPALPDITKNAVIEFHSATVAVKENVGKFPITVWRTGNLEPTVRVRVKSIDGSAKRGEDYVPVNQVLTFQSGEREKQVMVQIVDDTQWEPNEEFFLRLSLLHHELPTVQLGRFSVLEVRIIDNDDPGALRFEKRGAIVKESAGSVRLDVVRKRGADGEVAIKWRTIDRSAVSGRDYVGGEGVLEFKHGEIRRTIEIEIRNDYTAEKDEHFDVELYEPSGGARLGTVNRITVTISNDDDFNTIMEKMMKMTHVNLDALKIHRDTWGQQIKDAMLVRGGDIENATVVDYVLHFLSFFWKVLFSLVPPPPIMGGWLCFFCSLFAIGVMTALIGDIASIFGCMVGLQDAMTAITLVALGTSMPDTIASRSVLISSRYADSAIGNINGSNSVNVFLGLGLPWSIAAIYHATQGGTFRVASEGLGFSVLLYSVASILAMALFIIRRNVKALGRAEIGGPPLSKYISAGFFIFLWVAYITLSYLQIQKIITVNL